VLTVCLELIPIESMIKRHAKYVHLRQVTGEYLLDIFDNGPDPTQSDPPSTNDRKLCDPTRHDPTRDLSPVSTTRVHGPSRRPELTGVKNAPELTSVNSGRELG